MQEIFAPQSLLDELIEYGFPKAICEKYFADNPVQSIEVIVPELAVLVAEEEERIKEEERQAKIKAERKAR